MSSIKFVITLSLIFFFCLGTKPTQAQEYLHDVETITTDDGLANLQITTLFKSSDGFIWIGSPYGLNRYDGYSFRLYTEEKNGLSNHKKIDEIKEDDNGLLWLFCLEGINHQRISVDIFDPIHEKAVPFDSFFKEEAPFLARDIIQCHIEDDQKRIWIPLKNGALYKYENNTFSKVITIQETIQTVTVDENENIWIGAENFLYELDTTHSIKNKQEFNHSIYRIFNNDNNDIWVVSCDLGNYLINQNSQSFFIWQKKTNNNWEVFNLMKDGKKQHSLTPFLSKNGYWVARVNKSAQIFEENGDWIFDTQPSLNHYINVRTNKICYLNDFFWTKSSSGILKISIKKNPFTLVHQQKDNSLSDSRAFIEDENGNIYFSNRFLYKYQPLTQKLEKLEAPNLNHHAFYGLLIHQNDLIAIKRDIQTINLENLTISKSPGFRETKHQFNFLNVLETSVFPGQWAVGTPKGIYYYNPTHQKITSFPNSIAAVLDQIHITALYRNTKGLWVGSTNGIFLIDEQQATIRHFSVTTGDLPTNKIRHIYEDAEGIFWLSSIGEGIIKWQPNLKEISTFEQFTIKNGLSNNYIYAIYEDDFGFLWASSDRGLMRIQKSNFQVQIFLKENGLPHNEFNTNSHYKAKDGTMYFGGLGGIISFHPKIFLENSKVEVPLIFTNYTILEEGKAEATNRFEELQKDNSIKIKPSDKLFELTFALMDFAPSDFHQYRYKIEGYTENWTFTDQNKIRITNLPYGNYTLKIQGQHINKGWSNQVLSLKIKVLKPFYLQIWFIIILIFVVSIVTYFFFQMRLANLKKVQSQLEEEVKARTATIQEQTEELKKLDQAKTRFFSNITHEFRTPLTLILGPLEQIQEQRPPEKTLYKKLKGVQRNAQHLLGLINQLLDISKLESGNMKLETSHGDIVEQSQLIVQQMQPMANQKGLNLIFKSSNSHLFTNYDQNKWNKILFNLLSNAIKFTPENGTVSMNLKTNNVDLIIVEVQDTGRGIAPENLKNIFNRFYQTDDSSTRLQEGTGIGLALVKELVELQNGTIKAESQLGKGTTFILELPILVSTIETENELQPQVLAINPSIEASEKNLALTETVIIQDNKLQLLIIEDNQELRSYIRSCIDENIYQVTEAKDGEEGLEKAQVIIPDLIISDVMMPKKDGFEVTQFIRQTLSTSHIPIILLTAKSALESRLEGLRRGADAYLTKPFSPQELVLRIRKLIELRQMLQNRYHTASQLSNEHLIENEVSTFEKEDKFIADFKNYILENITDEDLNGDKLGKVFYLSRMQLHRKIKALTNLPTGQLVRTIRLEKAKELLETEKITITEVAYKTGFSSSTNFSRAFKKHFGASPSKINR
ncbi:MAG: hybrid sensor histidine kinase/response regulator transcription factor [Saprospiraceae bacterium]